jgi:hypothetical protein
MNSNIGSYMEISFDIFYLIVIYILVILMFNSYKKIKEKNLINDKILLKQLNLFQIGFLLLALGDTGHVGLRVISYILGDIEKSFNLFGQKLTLVGIGSFTTAFTVTLLYMGIAWIWKLRYHNDEKNNFNSFIFWLLLIVGFARLVVILLPVNNWGATTSDIPYGWSLFRNSFLTFQGLVVAILILLDSLKNKDKIFTLFSIFIFISYAFYIPVILFAKFIPIIGVLMIPKTCAYIAMAFYGYKKLYRQYL